MLLASRSTDGKSDYTVYETKIIEINTSYKISVTLCKPEPSLQSIFLSFPYSREKTRYNYIFFQSGILGNCALSMDHSSGPAHFGSSKPSNTEKINILFTGFGCIGLYI
jgi:hypothetical protein